MNIWQRKNVIQFREWLYSSNGLNGAPVSISELVSVRKRGSDQIAGATAHAVATYANANHPRWTLLGNPHIVVHDMDDIRIPDSGDQSAAPQGGSMNDDDPGDAVRLKFSKFVQLIMNHNFEVVLKEHAEEDIIVSSNLLTDLANAHEEKNQDDSRKLPLMLLVGIIVGIVITYLVLQF